MPKSHQQAESPTGRTLDVAVAEAVLGLRVVALDWPCGYSPNCGDYEASLDREPDSWRMLPDAVYCPVGGRWPPERVELGMGDWAEVADVKPVPFLSTEIGAAWAVVEALQARGWWLQMTTVTEGWLVIILQLVPRGVLARVVASTCSEALCRAALAAVATADEAAQTKTQEARR